MVNPFNSSSLSSDPQIITQQITFLVNNSTNFCKKAVPILKAYQEEQNVGFFGRFFHVLRDFFASFSVFIDPSPKVRLIRLIQDCTDDTDEKRINEVASKILFSSKIVLTQIALQQENQSTQNKTALLGQTIRTIPEAKAEGTIKGKVTVHSTDQTKSLSSNSWNPILVFFTRLFTSSELDEKGFKNLGSTCFMNSSIRLFLSKMNIEDLIFDPAAKGKNIKSLNRRQNESEETFSARQKLLGDIVSLHKEVKKEISDRKEIEKWLRGIGSNPIFNDRLNFFSREEDAHEFLSIVIDALELDIDYRMSLKSHRVVNDAGVIKPSGVDQALPIVELYASNQLKSNPKSLITENLAEEEIDGKQYTLSFRHPNLENLKSLMMRMPRFDAAMRKTSKQIQSVFGSFEIKVFDETLNKEVAVRLNPKSAVCHIGSSITSGHYVVIVREGDKYFEKSDSLIRELTKQQAESYAEEKVYLVEYDVEVVNDEVSIAIQPLDDASHLADLDELD